MFGWKPFPSFSLVVTQGCCTPVGELNWALALGGWGCCEPKDDTLLGSSRCFCFGFVLRCRQGGSGRTASSSSLADGWRDGLSVCTSVFMEWKGEREEERMCDCHWFRLDCRRTQLFHSCTLVQKQMCAYQTYPNSQTDMREKSL